MLGWSWPVSFEQPAWLLLLLTIPVIVLVALRTLRALNPRQRWLAIVLRALVVIVFALVLARIHAVRTSDRLAVYFLIDRSRSIPDEVRLKVEDYVRRSAHLAERNDKLCIVGFDGEANIDLPPSTAGSDTFTFGSAIEPDRTDIGRALRTAMATLPEGCGRRIVLATDMNENAGNVLDEVQAAAANGAVIDILPLDYDYPNEILFDRFVVPAQSKPETAVPLRMILKSRRPTRARIHLTHNGRPVRLEDDLVDLPGDMRPVPFKPYIQVMNESLHRFEARIEPLDPGDDTLPQNNVASAFTIVDTERSVLLLTQIEGDDDGRRDHQALVEALAREKIRIDVALPGEVAVDLHELERYGAVILANISADKFTEEEKQTLATYVRDLGGGLIMTGGNHSFGAGGWIGSPVEEISPVFFEVKHKKVIPRGGLAIVMHSCEIPRGNYWGEQVAIAATNTISSLDYIGVLAYSWSPGGTNWEVPLQVATNKPAIISTIKKMQIGDMPDFDPSLEMAIKGLMPLPGVSQRHVIIISDGDPSPPSTATLNKMVQNRITCSTVGIGYGAHVQESTLKQIANVTKGRFYRCTNPKQLPQIFVKEAKVVRRSLIDEKPFTPQVAYALAETIHGFAEAEFPPLGGLVLTTPKPQTIEMPLVRAGSDGNDPVMAHWQCELGKVLVFTSGQWPKWGPEWAGWARFGAFWAQTVRWVMRQSGSDDFEVMTHLEGDKGRVIVEALNTDASFLNEMRIAGRLITPDLQSRPIRLIQTGPGRYETTFDVKDNGQYVVNLSYAAPSTAGDTSGSERRMIRTGLSLPYSWEYRHLSANTALMNEVRDKTGGRLLTMDPKLDNVFHFDRPVTSSRQPVWRPLILWLLLPLFLLDVAGRRLASALALSIYAEATIFAVMIGLLITMHAPWWSYLGALVLAELIGWTIRREFILPTIRYFTHSVAALGRAGERSRASLAQLKTARDRVRGEMTEAAGEAPPARTDAEPPAIPLEAAPDRRARFDVGEAQAAKPAGDLTSAVGGATAESEAEKGKAKPAGTRKSPADELTSRLLKAKRRAQQDIEAKKKKEDT